MLQTRSEQAGGEGANRSPDRLESRKDLHQYCCPFLDLDWHSRSRNLLPLRLTTSHKMNRRAITGSIVRQNPCRKCLFACATACLGQHVGKISLDNEPNVQVWLVVSKNIFPIYIKVYLRGEPPNKVIIWFVLFYLQNYMWNVDVIGMKPLFLFSFRGKLKPNCYCVLLIPQSEEG